MSRHDDASLRALERQARSGDPGAARRLERAKLRTANLPETWDVVEVFYDDVNHAIALHMERRNLETGLTMEHMVSFEDLQLARQTASNMLTTALGTPGLGELRAAQIRATLAHWTSHLRLRLRSAFEPDHVDLDALPPEAKLALTGLGGPWGRPRTRCVLCYRRRETWSFGRSRLDHRHPVRLSDYDSASPMDVTRERIDDVCKPCGESWAKGEKERRA